MDDAPTGNLEQGEYWESRATSWIEAEDYTALISSSFGQRAMDALDPGPGDTVLDVGCGTGPTTIELARRVAPGGTVLGVDIAATMVDAARRRAAGAGSDLVEFAVADAQVDDLGAGAFDAVYSQFGVMFFADADTAFANLHAALRPGGRLGFTCWQDVFSNEWMLVPGAAVIDVTGEPPPMPGPGQPGPFSLADVDRIEQLLTGAGFGSISVEPSTSRIVVAEDRIELAVQGASRTGAVRAALDAEPDPAVRDRLLSAVRDAFAARVQDGQMVLGASAHIVTARA